MYFIASSFRDPITRKASTAGMNSVKGDWHNHGLGPLACKEKLRGQVCSSWEKGQLVSILGTNRMHGELVPSQQCTRSREQEVQSETQEAQSTDKEKPFPHGDGAAVGLGPREFWLSPGLKPRLGETLNLLVWPSIWAPSEQGVSSSLQSDLSVGCVLTWCFTFYGMFYILFIVGGDSIWLELYSS